MHLSVLPSSPGSSVLHTVEYLGSPLGRTLCLAPCGVTLKGVLRLGKVVVLHA